jgi:hypothetical protein
MLEGSDLDPAVGVIPQGWYPDPHEPADLRWWTGQEWTHHVQPRPLPPLPAMSGWLVDAGSV